MKENTQPSPIPPPPRRGKQWVVKGLICALIIGVATAGAVVISKKTPRARKRPPEKIAPIVRVTTVSPESHNVMIRAMATVVPAQELVLKSRVGGEVLSMNPEFTEGGFLKKDAPVLQIDPADYKLAVTRHKSAVTTAQYALKLEKGHQAVAKREWDLLNGNEAADGLDLELALRKPHLEKVNADLSAARADLKRAQLDLARTRISAPFNALVRKRNVEIGSQVSAQESLGELVGTDVYHIHALVPSDRLKWMVFPVPDGETGSSVRIVYSDGATHTGTVYKLLGDLETSGRMARVLISVPDPLGLADPADRRPPLLIGDYVRVEITGRQVDDVYRIPRIALRDDRHVWVIDSDESLEIREVDTVWRDIETVLIAKGLENGDRLIVSDIPAPVPGMPVKLEIPAAQTPIDPAKPDNPENG